MDDCGLDEAPGCICLLEGVAPAFMLALWEWSKELFRAERLDSSSPRVRLLWLSLTLPPVERCYSCSPLEWPAPMPPLGFAKSPECTTW